MKPTGGVDPLQAAMDLAMDGVEVNPADVLQNRIGTVNDSFRTCRPGSAATKKQLSGANSRPASRVRREFSRHLISR